MCIFRRTGFGLSPLTGSPGAVPLTRQQNLMVRTVWVTYALFYFGRVNMSIALPLLAVALNVSRAEVGAVVLVFFWVYGIGQFVNGEIGNHLSPFRMVSIGLLTIAAVNFAFAFQTSLVVMLALWGINGSAQSAGWAPMLRILDEGLDRSQIKRVSTLMPFSYVVGTAFTWTLVGAAAAIGGWQLAFLLPGLVMLGALVFWRRAGIDAPRAKSPGFSLSDVTADLRAVWLLLVSSAMAGFVFNGAVIWLPSYILDTGLIPDYAVGLAAAVMQVIAIMGLFLARYQVVRTNRVFATVVVMFTATALALLLSMTATGLLSLLFITGALMMLNGGFGLTISSMPLILAPPGRASSTTGSVNMMTSFFGGLAGFTIGGLVESSGWQVVFGLWAVILLMASLLIWLKRDEENKSAKG